MIDAEHYIRTVRYEPRSIEPPRLNCWGLWRYAVQREAGPTALDGLEVYPNEGPLLQQFRGLVRGRCDGSWIEVPHMGERPLDLALMKRLIGRGRTAKLVDLHCGVIVRPGMVMDVEDEVGVLVRAFRQVGGERPHPTMWGRIVAIYRWGALC